MAKSDPKKLQSLNETGIAPAGVSTLSMVHVTQGQALNVDDFGVADMDISALSKNLKEISALQLFTDSGEVEAQGVSTLSVVHVTQ